VGPAPPLALTASGAFQQNNADEDQKARDDKADDDFFHGVFS
jgi:hypothetical protein